MSNNIKQVIVVRTDLNMRKGKMCAQVAHASMKVFFDRMKLNVTTVIEDWSGKYQEKNADCNRFTSEMIEWMNGSFAKIVVGCNSEQELFDLQKQAEKARIVNALILDNGNTEFKNQCPNCEGTGNVGQAKASGYNNLILDVQCSVCKGTGKVNKPTYTCLAIGPDLSDKIDKITGGLKLL